MFFKKIKYEWHYLARRFKLVQALILLISFIFVIIMAWGDTHAFFLDETSPIPASWTVFKNRKVVAYIAVFVILASYVGPWLISYQTGKKESSELHNVIREHLVPAIDSELDQLNEKIKNSFGLKDTRISIFIPVRKGNHFLSWSFQMLSRTQNISTRELDAQFDLDEGVIGYTFRKNQKHCIEFIDLTDQQNLPETYKPLKEECAVLINKRLQAVLVAAVFQEGSIAGLLAIDTSDKNSVKEMEKYELHEVALDWIIDKSDAVGLLWRMKNHV